jgi:hypothetical protein
MESRYRRERGVRRPRNDEKQLPRRAGCYAVADVAELHTVRSMAETASAHPREQGSRTLLCTGRLQRLLLGWLQEATHAKALQAAGSEEGSSGQEHTVDVCTLRQPPERLGRSPASAATQSASFRQSSGRLRGWRCSVTHNGVQRNVAR